MHERVTAEKNTVLVAEWLRKKEVTIMLMTRHSLQSRGLAVKAAMSSHILPKV